MRGIEKSKAIESLKQSLTEIPHVRTRHHTDEDFPLWRSKINVILEDTFGSNSKEYQKFLQTGTRAHMRTPLMPDIIYQQDYIENLKSVEICLKSIIQKYEILGIAEVSQTILEKPLIAEKPKVFIAHGGKSVVLEKLREFIQALGLEPLVVELLPTKGMLVDEKVRKYMQEADCGIVLATRGGIIDKKAMKQHPRLNVIDELARLRTAFPDKTILLLEEGVELPSNLSGLTLEPFTRRSVDRAFTAIVRELKAFEILKAVRPQY